MVKPCTIAALALAACSLPGETRYRCEPGGACAQPGYVCDGTYCRPPGEASGGGSAGGGAAGGATAGGGAAGGATAGGGAAGGATAGGGAAGGGSAGGAVDAGPPCAFDAVRRCLTDAGLLCWDEAVVPLRDGGYIDHVSAVADDAVWFTAYEEAGAGQPATGVLLYFDGCNFQRRGSLTNTLFVSLWADSPQLAYAVGSVGGLPRIYTWSDGGLRPGGQNAPASVAYAVHGVRGGDVWAAANTGLPFVGVPARLSDGGWVREAYQHASTFWTVHAVSNSLAYFGGEQQAPTADGGTQTTSGVVRFTRLADGGSAFGTTRYAAGLGQVGPVYAIAKAPNGELYMAGDSPFVARWNMAASDWRADFTPYASAAPLGVTAIAATTQDVWVLAVPDAGVLLRYRTPMWTIVEEGVPMKTLDATPTTVWMAGERGVVRRYR